MTSEAIWIRILAAGALALGVSVAACADFSRGEPSPAVDAGGPPVVDGEAGDAAAGDGAAALSFATDVFPLATPRCGSSSDR